MWIGAGNGTGSSTLYRVADGKIEFQRSQKGAANSAYRAPDKTFWFGGEGGLWHMVMAVSPRIDLPQELADKPWHTDNHYTRRIGGMWVSFGPVGLYRLKDDVWTKFGGRRDFPASGV